MVCRAPWPTPSMAITAPTPMMMPSMVRTERILLRDNARIAMRMIASRSMFRSILERWQGLDYFRGPRPVHDGLVATNLTVAELNAALREIPDVRFVGHQHNRKALIVQFLENIHDFHGCTTIEIPRGFVR